MKLRKLLCGMGTITAPIMLASPILTSCGKNYSQLVKNVVSKLIDMDKYPRCTSKMSKEVCDYLDPIRTWITKEAVDSGISYQNINVDDYGNLWFDVAASQGYENYKPLVLQGHMDMVVDNLSEAEQPYTPIQAVAEWDKGIVHSKDYNTSLGADNGVALAIIFSLLQDSSFKHGPLRIIFSANEDSGMIGAAFINQTNSMLLKNMKEDGSGEAIENLLNIDCENIGYVERSCSGSTTLDFGNDKVEIVKTGGFTNNLYLDIKGLHGGHSGGDMDKGYASAEKCIYEILNSFLQENENSIQIVKHYHPNDDGTNISFKRNQIVTHARLVFKSNKTKDDFSKFINNKKIEWKTDYPGEDWDKVSISVNDSGEAKYFISAANSTEIINKIGKTSTPKTLSSAETIWFGYIKDEEGNIIKSQNISPITIDTIDENKYFNVSVTSQIRCKTNNALSEMETYYGNFNILSKGPCGASSTYPAWEAKDDNKMVDIAVEAFKKYGITAKVDDEKGGIEPTWWVKCNPNLHCTSIGPNIHGAHTKEETLEIDTIQPIIDVTKYICLQMKK